MPSIKVLNTSEAFARAIISMGRFMKSGHTYEEVYRYGVENTTNPDIRQIWQNMMAIAGKGDQSPAEALSGREELVTPWLLKVFLAGLIGGVETIWIKGGEAFLEVSGALRKTPRPDANERNRLISKLTEAGLAAGLAADFAASSARQFIEAVTSK